jgi:peptidoglycan/LPS O-acetylase OafA/YrhL
MSDNKQSWYSRVLGRSILSILFGSFFEKRNNTAGIIAVTIIFTLSTIVITKLRCNEDTSKEIGIISNIAFVVIGYYFGAKAKGDDKSESDEL